VEVKTERRASMQKRWIVPTGAAMFAVALAAFACGGGRGGYSTPTQPTPPSSGGATAAATIEIRNGAVNPKDVRIEVGQRVEFVNSDNVVHEIQSDPHGSHTDCPPTNAVGRLSPGQRRMTGEYINRRSCGFHDHMNPENMGLRGTIRVGVDEPGPPPTYLRQ
jgi:plastocyanin